MSEETLKPILAKYFATILDGGQDLSLDEAQEILQAVWDKFADDEGGLLVAYGHIQNEFQSGHRCSVCGNTEEQSKALNYDCINEC